MSAATSLATSCLPSVDPGAAAALLTVARSECILGGQKSGKSRRAEQLAAIWLAQSAAHRAVLLATAHAHDAEMRARIERHRRERSARVPGLQTLEAPPDLPAAIAQAGGAQTLRVVDCLTLWLTGLCMPGGDGALAAATAANWQARADDLLGAIQACPGPIVLVSNEIGLGVVPLGRSTRAFVDALGALNQRVAQVCARVTFMAAGLPLTLKAS
ncbi:MAG: bifunctional adenosylcobinamide kinase/adenosylcobinamide-phosphate guanylyltransferase [Burkholderiaceae bacterium]|jgi:adenosylcobinamide kinase/adenosylcobinamide-phosphate guanylyltransferase|nr:bifunctional adenosylcobinamide kinase/adenosylcobinamide-phosphate guanylyltransferase [Burkholderiaceae bacterium]